MCYQHLSKFLAIGHLPCVLDQSFLSPNDKGDNRMKLGTAHRSPGIYLTAEENPGKPQLEDHLMKSVQPVIVSNKVFYL
jgi:hypothetical protein